MPRPTCAQDFLRLSRTQEGRLGLQDHTTIPAQFRCPSRDYCGVRPYEKLFTRGALLLENCNGSLSTAHSLLSRTRIGRKHRRTTYFAVAFLHNLLKTCDLVFEQTPQRTAKAKLGCVALNVSVRVRSEHMHFLEESLSKALRRMIAEHHDKLVIVMLCRQ